MDAPAERDVSKAVKPWNDLYRSLPINRPAGGYASQALKDGYVQIANIFTETANNEKEHAKIWYKLLHNGIGNTEENLKLGAEGEHFEWAEMYKSFAEEAKEEGFNHIAYLFEQVAKIEKEHEERYLTLLNNVKGMTVFAKEEEIVWICSNCGHIHRGKTAPHKCPVCEHPQAFFHQRAVNYQ